MSHEKMYWNMQYMQKKSVCSKKLFAWFSYKKWKMTPDMTIYRNEKNVTLDYHTCNQYHECKYVYGD